MNANLKNIAMDFFLIMRNLSLLILIFVVFMTVAISLFLTKDEIEFIGKICLSLISSSLILSIFGKMIKLV